MQAQPVKFHPRYQNQKQKKVEVPPQVRKFTSFSEKRINIPTTDLLSGKAIDLEYVDITELSCDFGITEGLESDDDDNNKLIHVTPKLLPQNLNKFIQAVQKEISEDEVSNNFRDNVTEEKFLTSTPVGTPSKDQEKHLTPKIRRTFPILIQKDMSSVSLGRSKKILYGKLKQMGLVKSRSKRHPHKSSPCL